MFKTCLLVGQPYFVTIFTDVDRDQLACCLGLYVAYSPRALWLLVVRGDGREYPEVSGHVKAGRVCAGRSYLAMVSVQLRLRKMRADSASHLLRHPINFELFLFLYLVCALLLQKINIYKKVGGGRYLEINFFVCVCVSLCSKYHVTLFKKCIYSSMYSCHTSRTTYTSHTTHTTHTTHTNRISI